MRIFTIMVFVIIFVSDVWSQKMSETREQVWFGYFNQTRFTDRSGLHVDLQLRFNDYVNQKSFSIARIGYTYFCSDQLRLTAGYGFITHYSLTAGQPDIPESRPWQQVQWFDKKKKVSLSQYLRIEERFVRRTSDGALADDHRFTWRFRYNFAVSIPLKGEAVIARTPFLFFNDEILINAGKNVINNYFDQNRLVAGLGYQFTNKLNAQLGYIYVFQQLPAGNQYIHINALRLSVLHIIDLRHD
jgi:hypothetical protein